jgi:hypothetical protein
VANLIEDIYSEREDIDVDTLKNLGPLRPLAGIWQGSKSVDVNPKAEGPVRQPYVEQIDLQPIDPQSNGPQLFYGLRYHTHIVKPGEIETYHDQVGYWLWEPATATVILSLAIPRAQVALAAGHAEADATVFEVSAARGKTDYGICSTSFLERAFRTDSFVMKVTIHPDGTWSYVEDTLLMVRGTEPFHHTDQNRLSKIGEPTPNPLAR